MAISVEDTYPGKATPGSSNYPEGAVKNETVPDSSDDGTPLDELWGNDFEGLKQALMRSNGSVPTAPGNIPDTALASQILQSLVELAQGRAINFDEVGIVNEYELNVRANQQPPAGLFNGQIFGFNVVITNTNASTLDLETLITGAGIVDIETEDGNALAGNELLSGKYVQVRYLSATNKVEIVEFGSVTPLSYGRVVRTAGDVSTTSTSLVDLTGATVTITTGANPVAFGAIQSSTHDSTNGETYFNVDIDGTLQFGTAGLWHNCYSATGVTNASFSSQTDALAAGSHTIKEKWRTNTGTATLKMNTANNHIFWAREIK